MQDTLSLFDYTEALSANWTSELYVRVESFIFKSVVYAIHTGTCQYLGIAEDITQGRRKPVTSCRKKDDCDKPDLLDCLLH